MDGEMEKKKISSSADFSFESRYASVEGHRIHYVEEGEGEPVLFLHGNPTSSYLWRNILPKVASSTGRRGIALDLLGFGKSDKPGDVRYSVRLHADIVEAFIDRLDLKNLILVAHDWGGPLGAAYAVNHPEKVQGLALMETFIWPLAWKDFGKFAAGFRLFRSPLGYVLIQVMNAFVNRVLPGAVLKRENMTEEVMSHYREPFPTIDSRRAVRVFPQLLPIAGRPPESDQFFEELQQKLRSVTFPVLWLKAEPGVIVSVDTAYHLSILQKMLPQLIIKDFGPGLHYLPEDDPGKIVDLVVEWMRQSKLIRTEFPPSRIAGIKHAA